MSKQQKTLLVKPQKTTTILVTGANGQLGETIKDLYSKNNWGIEFSFITKADLDITNQSQVKTFFNKQKFDYCINCAAYTNVEQAEKTPKIAIKVNAEGVKNLAESCKEHNTTLIHISTDYVFDGKKKSPYLETDKPNPINEYGKSKLLGEQHIKNILQSYFIIRTSWLYSKKYGKNFYRFILTKAKTEKELSITTEQVGCPTDTVNLSAYIISLILQKSTDFGVYHFSDNNPMTWYDFAKSILVENNLNCITKLVKADNYRTFAKRPKYSVLLKSKTNDNPNF